MIKKNRNSIILLVVLITAAILRFFNLMFDSPYFFNPDERNMANATSQFRLPSKLSNIPRCILSEFNFSLLPASRLPLDANSCNLNPHFFAYGQFPLYLAFVSDQITKPVLKLLPFTPKQPTIKSLPSPTSQPLTTSFPSAIFWLRFYSALSSTFIVLMVFLISKQFLTFNFALLTSALSAFTPGLIQSAHFGTTESLLTFLFLTSVYLSIRYLSHLSYFKFVVLSSLTIGLALGSKLTGIFFYIPPILAITIHTIKQLRQKKKKRLIVTSFHCYIVTLLVIGSILIFVLSSPYNLVEFQAFKSAIFGYEADVATGRFPAFYTRQFQDTVPILFQIEKIFPYALGWPVFILGTTGFLLLSISLISRLIQSIIKSIKYHVLSIKGKKHISNIPTTNYLLLATSFLIYFLPNSFLFAKWTRFITPILPLFSVFASYGLYRIYQLIITFYLIIQKSKIKNQNYKLKFKILHFYLSFYILIFAFCIVAIIPGAAFMSIYTHEDTRVQASRWIYDNIADNSYILFDTANVIDIPLGLPDKKEVNKNYKLVSFDFYHLDENKQLLPQLLTHLEKADYIFVPSRRIFKNHMRFPDKFPLVTKYYQSLFSGKLGFEHVAIFTSYPSMPLPLTANPYTLITFPDEDAEESWSVFDHPVVRIYKKVYPMNQQQYSILLNEN